VQDFLVRKLDYAAKLNFKTVSRANSYNKLDRTRLDFDISTEQ